MWIINSINLFEFSLFRRKNLALTHRCFPFTGSTVDRRQVRIEIDRWMSFHHRNRWGTLPVTGTSTFNTYSYAIKVFHTVFFLLTLRHRHKIYQKNTEFNYFVKSARPLPSFSTGFIVKSRQMAN